MLHQIGRMPVPSLENGFLVLVLEQNFPLAVRYAEFSDYPQPSITLNSTEYDDFVVQTDSAVLVSGLRIRFGRALIDLELVPDRVDQIISPHILEKLVPFGAPKQVKTALVGCQ